MQDNKYYGALVIFEKCVTKEEALTLIDLIKRIKGISAVDPQKEDSIEAKAIALARREVVGRIYDMLIFLE